MGVGYGLIIGIIFAVVCGLLARRKGRNTALFAVLGFFFSLITLIVLLILPSRSGSRL
jgi:predicted PurR-regulated permease PerM